MLDFLSKREQTIQALFVILAESRVLCETLRRTYNEESPHQSLGHQTPYEYK